MSQDGREAARAENRDPSLLIPGHAADDLRATRRARARPGPRVGVAVLGQVARASSSRTIMDRNRRRFLTALGAVPFALCRTRRGSRGAETPPRALRRLEIGPPIVLEASRGGVPPRIRRCTTARTRPGRSCGSGAARRQDPPAQSPQPARPASTCMACRCGRRWAARARSAAAWRPARRPRSPSCLPTAGPSGSTPGSSTGTSTQPPRDCRACSWSKRRIRREVDADEGRDLVGSRSPRPMRCQSSRASKDRLWIDGAGLAQESTTRLRDPASGFASSMPRPGSPSRSPAEVPTLTSWRSTGSRPNCSSRWPVRSRSAPAHVST